MTAYVIARPRNGISLNGDEYVCGEDGRCLIWRTEIEAECAMLKRFSADEIAKQGIHVKEIELE